MARKGVDEKIACWLVRREVRQTKLFLLNCFQMVGKWLNLREIRGADSKGSLRNKDRV